MILPPGIRYSILRNNVEVPLIPVDQLPFQIQGLPRELTPLRSHEEGWKSIGETQQPALPLSIRAPADLRSSQPVVHTNRRFLPPDHDARKDLATTAQVSKPLRKTFSASVAPTEGAVHHLINTSPAVRPTFMTTELIAATPSEGVQYPTYRRPNPSGIEPDPSKKEYCTHWIRTNSCDYMQQGCRFKHEMPDRKKLEELGFPQIPKWYRDKTAIFAGASSWLRPHAAQDGNDRQLSVEPSASRTFRPSILGLTRNQSRVVELPGSPAPKADQVPVEMPNLIDIDETSTAAVSLSPSLSISSLSSTASLDAKAVNAQVSGQVAETLAFSLRQEESEVKRNMNFPTDVSTLTTTRASGRRKSNDAPLVASVELANDIENLPPKTLPQAVLPDLSKGQEASKANASASKATKGGHPIVKSSKPQKKRSPRTRKLAERAVVSATSDGLASSQHATGKKPREGHTPSKGPKRGSVQGEGKDLQFEIVQRQRAVHEQEWYRKDATSNSVRPPIDATRTKAS